MTLSKNSLRRALAVGAASALGLSGLLIASPALAEDSSSAFDVESGSVAAVAQALAAENDSIQGAALNAEGDLVVIAVADTDAERSDVEATVKAAGHGDPENILYLAAPAESAAATDVVGGAGYLAVDTVAETAGLCSVGFSAWDATGNDAVITAGHCASGDVDTTVIGLTEPAGDPAGGGAADGSDIVPADALGTFGFAQFGGPAAPGDPVGSNPGAEGDVDSIDIAVIDVSNGGLSLKPEVTDWTTVADLSASTTKITSVGSARAGIIANKSGRTTGVTTGVIDLVDGSLQVSGKFVHGFFVVGALTIPGDSGGAVYAGSTALGVTSATAQLQDGTELTWASDLVNALPYTDGYAVKLFVEAPAVTTATGSDVERGGNITGTSPAGTTVTVTPAGGTAFDATSDAAGAWSFPAPSTLGTYDFTVQATKGFDTSGIVASSVDVVAAPLLAPVITAPGDGAVLTAEITTVSGTGLPGATVTVTGDATGTATVASDGTYTVTLNSTLSYGHHALSVTQAYEDQISPAATTEFALIPATPGITSPAPGSSFELADAPSKISGTGIDGATVTVSLDGVVIGEVQVVDGVWTIEIDPALGAGSHTVTVTQAVEGIASANATTTFSVLAPVVVDPPTVPGDKPDNGLAKTGVESLGFIGGAVALLLAGGLVLVMRRRVSAE